MDDLVIGRPPLGLLGRAARSLYVAPMLRRITSCRAQMIARPPVARANSCAASTFGPIEPAGKS